MSLVSGNMRIKGDCVTDGRLRIQGTITGNVTAKGIELESSGRVQGDVGAPEGTEVREAFLIDGAVEGAVRARVVEVGRNGAVSGGVVADDAVIHGRVQGGILARKSLALEETAVVEGDVRARRLALKEGGQVNGTIRMGENAAAEAAGKAGEKASSRDTKDEAEPVAVGARAGGGPAKPAKPERETAQSR